MSPRSAAAACAIIDRDGNSAERPVRESELSADAAEKGQYRALHAQGNPRAAARRRQHAAGARGQRPPARGRVRARPRPRSSSAPRHVHIVACGTSFHAGIGRALLHRADLQDSLRGRDRQRIPLSQSAGAAELAVRDHLAVGRDRRHAGRAAPGQAVRLSLDACDLQRPGELAGARVRAGHADARGSGDRRRLDQGLHHAARRARHAGHRARQAPRRGRRARARPGHAARSSCRR